MKKTISVILSIIMLVCSLPISAFATSNGFATLNEISIGDEITMGTYNGEPITWVCGGIDANGALLISKDVICQKEFDAAGQDSQYHSDGWGYVRENNGSNCWEDSNIRQWLNTSGEVTYTHCAPSYSNELGFLSCFTTDELSCIIPITHTITVNEWETHRERYCDGGSRETSDNFSSDSSVLGTFPTDLSAYYHKTLTDYVFLLGQDNIVEIYNNLGAEIFKASSEWYTIIANNTGASYESIHTITTDAGTSYCAAKTVKGIRPAFYYNGQSMEDDTTSVFTLGVDNNNFVHTSSSTWKGAGFAGVTDYTIDDEYFNRLTANSSKSEKNKIKKQMKQKWEGSCYGIAMSMGLLYENYIGIGDLTDEKSAKNY